MLPDYVYQDEHLVVVNKPSGVLVHPSQIDRHEQISLMASIRDDLGQHVYPVHRLDKATSGLIVFGLNRQVTQDLSHQWQAREVSKYYLAVLRGYIDSRGEIDKALKPVPMFKQNRARLKEQPAQEAITQFQRLGQLELEESDGRFPTSRYSLVLLKPLTGRTHQLRRHMKSMSHPIVGDVKYGKGLHKRIFQKVFNLERLLLHSARLVFIHPVKQQRLVLTAQPEALFDRLIRENFGVSERDINEAISGLQQI